MPDPVHCDERMELARLIPGFQALPKLLVFRCSHCGHVETLAARPEKALQLKGPALTQRSPPMRFKRRLPT